MKKFTLKTKHLKLNHIINLGLMRHWVDFLLHFYRLNICLRVSLFSLSQKLLHLGILIIIEGTELKDALRRQDGPLGNRFNESLFWTRKNTPDEAAWKRTYGLPTRFFKKISPHAVAAGKVTFHFLKRPKYQWVNDLLKAQNTLTLRQREILRTSVFTLQTSKYWPKEKGDEYTQLNSLCHSEDRELWLKSLLWKHWWGWELEIKENAEIKHQPWPIFLQGTIMEAL